MENTDNATPTLDDIWAALADVPDPEIPPVSVVDLGMVHDVRIDGDTVSVRFLPTFAGCPALELIGQSIREAIEQLGFAQVKVEPVFDPAWTTDRITAGGLRKLKQFGLAPPGKLNGRFVDISMLQKVACPYCDSRNTTLESTFGPTLCRAIHYCNACRNSFEQFKPV